jgi:hypothetical protein
MIVSWCWFLGGGYGGLQFNQTSLLTVMETVVHICVYDVGSMLRCLKKPIVRGAEAIDLCKGASHVLADPVRFRFQAQFLLISNFVSQFEG